MRARRRADRSRDRSCGSKPGSIELAFCNARANRPAPTTRTMPRATWPTTNAFRSRRRPDELRESSLSAETTPAFDAWRAGTRPDSTPATSVSAAVNAITRPSNRRDTLTGSGNAGSRATRSDDIPWPSSSPAAPPRRNSTIVSVRSCRTSRMRPAPTASRTAISRRRALARANRMPAMFAHAMTSTRDTIPMSKVRNPATGPPLPGMGDEATSRSPFPLF